MSADPRQEPLRASEEFISWFRNMVGEKQITVTSYARSQCPQPHDYDLIASLRKHLDPANPAIRVEPPPGEGTVRVLDLVLNRMSVEAWPQYARETAKQIEADLVARAEMGRAKYGNWLWADEPNRNPLVDLYQEILDGIMYAVQAASQQRGQHAIQAVLDQLFAAALEVRRELNSD